MEAKIVLLRSRIDRELFVEQINSSLYLSISRDGSRDFVSVSLREGSDTTELVSMEIYRGDRTIMRLCSDLARVQEEFELMESANVPRVPL